MVLTPLGHTHILYEAHSIPDFIAACLALSPFLVATSLVTHFAVKRCCETLFLLAGLVVSTVVNLLVKGYIQQPRPMGSHRTDYGMPSDHSQFFGFLAVYGILGLYSQRVVWRPAAPTKYRCARALSLLAVAVAWSRVRLGLHSLEQVSAGLLLGGVLAACWDSLGKVWVRPRGYRSLRNSKWGRAILLTDWAAIPDPVELQHVLGAWASDAALTAGKVISANPEAAETRWAHDPRWQRSTQRALLAASQAYIKLLMLEHECADPQPPAPKAKKSKGKVRPVDKGGAAAAAGDGKEE